MFAKALQISRIGSIHFFAKRDIKQFTDLSNQSPWDLLTGVCVERLPIVTAPLTDMQKKFKSYLETIEIENSLKSDHELRHEKDKIQEELLKNESADVDIDAASKTTAQDFEDSCNEEFAKFKFPSIETEADKKNDIKSLERSMQRHLVLVTEHKLGKDVKYLLPQGIRKEGETLRQTAERVLSENCGPNVKVKFIGNAPCGFYKYKYPKEIDGKIGAKIFFYYARHLSGNLEQSLASYKWLTRTELDKTLPPRYKKSVDDFLVTETY